MEVFLGNPNKNLVGKISCHLKDLHISCPWKGKLAIFEQKLISSPRVRINIPTGEYYST